jgi:deazaflavin-dependent oxidoreductase (nitroreductase family)
VARRSTSKLQNAAAALHRGLFRLSRGRFLGRVGGLGVLLLTTRGRRTGKARTIPLLYVDDAGDYVLIASNGGAELHPAWYLNLQARPDATVEIGGRKVPVRATDVVDPDARARLWKRANEGYGSYDGYATKTDRTIPVVRLHPTSES